MGEDILKLKTEDIVARSRLLENETKILKSEIMRISHEHQSQKEKIKENKEKIKLNKTLPYLVSNVVEVIGRACARPCVRVIRLMLFYLT